MQQSPLFLARCSPFVARAGKASCPPLRQIKEPSRKPWGPVLSITICANLMAALPTPGSSGNRQQPETERLEPGVGNWCPHPPFFPAPVQPPPAPASAGTAICTCSLDLPFFPYWPPGYPNALRTNSIQISVPFNLLIFGFID